MDSAVPAHDQDMDMSEDWFEETDARTQGTQNDPLVHQEWNRISTKYSDAGYREGITDGKLSTLQKGFDEGYALSSAFGRKVGYLRGKMVAIIQFSKDPSVLEESRELSRQLGMVKRDDILPIDMERINHEKEDVLRGGQGEFVLDVNEQREMERLEDAFSSFGTDATGEGLPSVKGDMDGGEILARLERRVEQLEARAFGI